MKTLLLAVSLLLVSQFSVAASNSSQAIVGKVRGLGARNVLVETPDGRMVTVARSSFKKGLKMGGRVTLSAVSRASQKSRRRS